jgi:hypothetical protein
MANYRINIYRHVAKKIGEGEISESRIKNGKNHDVAEWNSVIMGICHGGQINSRVRYFIFFLD